MICSRPIVQKSPRFENEKLRRAIASLPCISCGIEDASQCAHANSHPFGKGGALKSHDYNAFSLCHEGANGCHASHDQNKASLNAIQRIDLEYEYIAKTHAQLWQRGLIKVSA